MKKRFGGRAVLRFTAGYLLEAERLALIRDFGDPVNEIEVE